MFTPRHSDCWDRQCMLTCGSLICHAEQVEARMRFDNIILRKTQDDMFTPRHRDCWSTTSFKASVGVPPLS